MDNTFGKWPRALGNAVFLDSNYLVDNFVQMFSANFLVILNRNSENLGLLLQSDAIIQALKAFATNASIDDYAMTVAF